MRTFGIVLIAIGAATVGKQLLGYESQLWRHAGEYRLAF
jgi:hypothetical protein